MSRQSCCRTVGCCRVPDTVGQMSDAVGQVSECRMSELSDSCRKPVRCLSELCRSCRTMFDRRGLLLVSDTVGLSDCRMPCRILSDTVK